MKRTAVLKKIKAAARRQGLSYEETELTNHTGITSVGCGRRWGATTRSTT